jgi:hypothetical protein
MQSPNAERRRCFRKLSKNKLIHYELFSDTTSGSLKLVTYSETSTIHTPQATQRRTAAASRTQGPLQTSAMQLYHDEQLLDSTQQLFGIGIAPRYYDVVFEVWGENNITRVYATKAILFVTCDHLARLARDYVQQPIIIQNVGLRTFSSVIQFCFSAKLSENNPLAILDIIRYATEIEFTQCADVAQQRLTSVLRQILVRDNIEEAIALYDSIYRFSTRTEEIDIQPVLSLFSKYLLSEDPSTFFSQANPLYMRFSSELLKDIVTEDRLHMSEMDLFERLFEWGIVQLFENYQEDLIIEDSEIVYVLDYSEGKNAPVRITVMEHVERSTTIKIVSVKQLRATLEELLHHVRFENIPVPVIVNKVATKKLFTNDEVLQMIEASVSRSSYRPFSILGRLYHTPRSQRYSISAHVSRIQLRYSIPAKEFVEKKKVKIPQFEFAGSRWYIIAIQTEQSNLSLYLYNCEIEEGNMLRTSLSTTVSFEIVNKRSSVSQKCKFNQTWSNTKAWGCGNIISITELLDEQKGYVMDGLLTITLEIEET